jgi:hypothetical protein
MRVRRRPVDQSHVHFAQPVCALIVSRYMKTPRWLLLTALTALTLATPAPAGAAFGPAQRLALPVAAPLSAALSPDGAAVI